MKRFVLSAIVLCVGIFSLLAQIPAGYYNAAEGKKNGELKTALFNKIKNHINIGYRALWDMYGDTDLKPGTNYIWDIYSNCNLTYITNQDGGSGGTSECDKYNREHTIPQSWFDEDPPMVSDGFQVYPTDKKVNGDRGNLPYGEVQNASNTYGNGSKRGSPKTIYGSISGTVFEPIDEYKGDLARTYFYMATCYEDKCNSWGNGVFGSANYGLTDYAKNLFMAWTRLDPVSQKEIDRNNKIYSNWQGNRNPFIDHPELAEYIWGNRVGQAWTSTPTGYEDAKFVFSVSPNPAADYIRISSDNNVDYTIYSLVGKGVVSGTVVAGGDILVSNLPNGVYIIHFTRGKTQQIEKLIVSR